MMYAAFISPVIPFAPWAAAITRLMPELDLRCWPDVGDPAEIEAAIVWRPPAGSLAQLPNLRVIQVIGAGVDHVLNDPGLPPRVPVLRLVDPGMTIAMMEYVALQVLRLHRHDPAYREQQAKRVWHEHPQPLAAQRRVGVLGLGVLGGAVARRLKAIGFDVAGWRRSSGRRTAGIPQFTGPEGLIALAARSEILVCLLPLTPQTTNILDARLFAAMPKGAAIVNVGRGAHVADADLIAALDSGQLSAAVLDVFRQEPLPPAHPFWNHPRIIITPHSAAPNYPHTSAPVIAEALRRIAAGKRPTYVVTRKRGY
jgi:glyoxylate/hydroxypyruvate reductase A